MVKPGYSTDVLELSAGSGTIISNKSDKGFWSKGRIIMTAIVAACVLGLALGLGLGLGLNSGSNKVESSTCRSQFNTKGSGISNRIRWKSAPRTDNTTWVPDDCPTPGNPHCPTGFKKSRPPLFLLSLDGFRAEYLLRGDTPMLKKLSECGLHAPYMRAMFPTKTFPNHYTLVTGMYAESHGIIDNSFYDPVYKETFSYGGRNRSDNRWWGGEPIWNTATKAGLKVATVMWVGSDVNIQGIRPEICYDYNSSIPLDVRVSEILSFFDGDPDEYPDLVVFYFEQPDSAGHAQGPFGDWVKSNLTYADRLVSDLVKGLTDRGMGDCFNFVIVADHGMESISCSEIVDISQYLDTQSLYTVYSGSHARMSSQYRLPNITNPSPVPVEETLEQLKCVHYNTTKDWYARYHAKEDLPKRYHYALHRRIDEIVMDVELEYSVVDLKGQSCSMSAGNHGYDNTLSSMHAIFIAYGPAFKKGLTLEEFENIEIYNLLADILGITPAPNNGTQGLLHHLLHDHTPSAQKEIKLIPPLQSLDVAMCSYPDDVTEREKRRNTSDCVCIDWTDLTNKSAEEMDEQLKLNSSQSDRAIQNHCPMGAPNSASADVSCMLVQNDYVIGSSENYRMPLWSSFHLSQGYVSMLEPGSSRSDKVADSCYRADVRMASQFDCSAYENSTAGIYPAFLYPPGFSNGTVWETDGYVSSNIVPMFRNFRWGVWRELLVLIEEYAEKYSDLHLVLGPVFDYNYDGLKDELVDILKYVKDDRLVPVPTHYYAIVTRCPVGQDTDQHSCYNATTVLSFILPHKSSYTECWERNPREYLRRHGSRVKDIQMLTGLNFFPDLQNTDVYTYRKLITHLSEHLWAPLSWTDAAQGEQCLRVETAQCPPGYDKPPVILISLDGFRPDYLERGNSPTLNALRGCGVSARYMHPIYPSMTFPSHHTMATGLYPESHGIVDNNMYDQELDESFYIGSPSSTKSQWWKGQPIWTALELQNKTAMTFFWPGSEVPFEDRLPTRYMTYNGQIPYTLRIDTVLNWLNGSEGVRPDLIALYLSKVDSSGHDEGPNSPKVDEAIRIVDDSLLRLMDGLYRMKLHTCVNIVIVSDHGMSDISCQDQSVLVTDKLPEDYWNRIYVYTGSNGRISNKYRRSGNNYYPVPTEQQVPAENLTEALACQFNNLVAMETKDFPVRYHYGNNPRTDDVQLLLADNWLVGYTSPPYCSIKGQHGWDPQYENMKAIFIGYGPGFLNNHTVEPFNSIELYNLLTHLTNISGSTNNGTEGSLYHTLREPPPLSPLDPPPENDYVTCAYPQSDEEYFLRANITNSECSCNSEADEIREYDDRLNFTTSQQNDTRSKHCGTLGIPSLLGLPGIDACLLYHNDYVSGYSSDLKIPVWTSFRLTAGQVGGSNPGQGAVPVGCNRGDVRLEADSQMTCGDLDQAADDMIQVQLFPANWSSNANASTESHLATNVALMINRFYEDIWSKMLERIGQWAERNGEIQVIVGPAFDRNSDGLRDENITRTAVGDFSLASHYFVITSRCTPGVSVCPGVDTQAFLLPHRRPNPAESCLASFDEYLLLNIARVRDVELLTGLQFFTSSSRSSLQPAILSRTFFQDTLWS